MPHAIQPHLDIELTSEELELLRDLDFPCSEELLARARATTHGQRLRGTVLELESLVRWVAFEANHSRPGSRRAALLNDIADEIEAALAARPR